MDELCETPASECDMLVDVVESEIPIRLNLGAGDVEIDGYIPIDRKNGKEVFPLDYEDGTVEDIYASHVLEHFPHGQIGEVLGHWALKLKPGGRLRVAVPNFAWVAEHYMKGEPIPTGGYVMGSQSDENDFHRSLFDAEYLTNLMILVGLERIGEFESEYKDCSSLPVSLNLQAFRPVSEPCEIDTANIRAILSAPRFGPTLHFRNAGIAFGSLRIPYVICQGAYWHQVLSEQLEESLARDPMFIIICDYDSVFSRDEVKELIRLIRGCAAADAICAVQMKRCCEYALFGIVGPDGKPKSKGYAADFNRFLTQITTGHFGLTIFRAESLRTFPRPWFEGTPSKEGRWNEGAIHPDIAFWKKWSAEGRTLFLANRIPIGHIEEAIKWPDREFKPVYQDAVDYHDHGIPKEVIRCVKLPTTNATTSSEKGNDGAAV